LILAKGLLAHTTNINVVREIVVAICKLADGNIHEKNFKAARIRGADYQPPLWISGAAWIIWIINLIFMSPIVQ
jgi:hypothetical protein